MLIFAIIATVINIIILIIKFRRRRFEDAALDAISLTIVFWVFKGSELILLVGIFSSLVVSVYLWFSPPHLRFVK